MTNQTQVITIPVPTSIKRCELKGVILDALEMANLHSKSNYLTKTARFEQYVNDLMSYIKENGDRSVILLPLLLEARLREDFLKIERLAKKSS